MNNRGECCSKTTLFSGLHNRAWCGPCSTTSIQTVRAFTTGRGRKNARICHREHFGSSRRALTEYGVVGNLRKRWSHPSRQGASRRALFVRSTCTKDPQNHHRIPPRCRSLRSPLCCTGRRPPGTYPAMVFLTRKNKEKKGNHEKTWFNRDPKQQFNFSGGGTNCLNRATEALFRVE